MFLCHLVCVFVCCLRSFFALSLFFFFNDTATTEIYTLSLHDALPIAASNACSLWCGSVEDLQAWSSPASSSTPRSEEHTSELQSHSDLVCRLLLEKKKTNKGKTHVNDSEDL